MIQYFLYIILLLGTQMTLAENPPAKNPVIIMHVKDGPIHIELYPHVAPKHVERILQLSREKFYDGIVFHRVIDGFMVQTGDPQGTGAGGSELPNLKAEFNEISHERGVVSMARASDPHSANSQFFIMLADTPYLDGQYTAFGRVVQGMEHVDSIKKGDSRNNGSVKDPDKIDSIVLVEEAK